MSRTWLCCGLAAMASCGPVGTSSNPSYPSVRIPASAPKPAPAVEPSTGKTARPPPGDTIRLRRPKKLPDGPPAQGYAPDPVPLRSRRQWELEIWHDRGEVSVRHTRALCLARPATTERQLGRFAFELWIGRELIDRVRFDFPLLAGEQPRSAEERRPIREVPLFGPGAKVSRTIRVPASERIRQAWIIDRATGTRLEVPWPPVAPGQGFPFDGCPTAP